MDEADILTTTGIRSEVKNEYGDVLGHVMLVDYDGDGGYLEADKRKHPGINILLESSEGKYHLWNLTVRALVDTLGAMAELHGDPSHLPPGYRRGYWCLRTTEKRRPSEDIYKERPEVVEVVANTTAAAQSRPHWEYVKAWWDIDAPAWEKDVSWVGHSPVMDMYPTMTDKAKAAYGDDGG